MSASQERGYSSDKKVIKDESQDTATAIHSSADPPYSNFTSSEKMWYAWIASVGAFASPVSSAIYYPAIASIAAGLNTSVGNINLTITTYMVRMPNNSCESTIVDSNIASRSSKLSHPPL